MSLRTKIYVGYLLVALLPFLGGVLPVKAAPGLLAWVPYWGLGLAAFLGLQLNQTRMLAACLWLAGSYFFLRQPGLFQGLGLSPLRCLEVNGVSLPLSFALIFSFRESRFLSSETLFRFFLAALAPGFFLALFYVDPVGFQAVFYWGLWPPAFPLPELSLVATLAWLGLFLYWKEEKSRLFLAALTAALIPFYLALDRDLTVFHTPFALLPTAELGLCFTAATAVLLHAAFHSYWNRVYLDPLTGIPNRQALEDRLHTLSGRFTLAMMDIDHFKHFNDTYGHEEGDNVLRMVAQHLHDHLGTRAFRYGGEEFCAVLEDLPGEEALELLEGMRRDLEERKFVIRKRLRKKVEAAGKAGDKTSGRDVRITVSIGLACPDKKHPTYAEVLTRADQALYQAKEKGRNRSVLAG